METKANWTHETRLERAGRRQTVYNLIHSLHMLQVRELEEQARLKHIESDELRLILGELKVKGLVYSPKPGMVGCVDE
jgi:hypothetical protein